MGLDDAAEDLVPDGEVDSGSSSSTQEEEKDLVVFSSAGNTKKFTQERWEEIKTALTRQLGYTVDDIEDMTSSERFEVIHEAALLSTNELDLSDSETAREYKCAICGSRMAEDVISEIAGEYFCPNHPAAKLDKHFNG